MCKISVVMPAYNAEKYIEIAIKSVLNQSFQDFEFIIVDDGSTDETVSIIRSFTDERIRLFICEHDFIRTLNTGLEKVRSKYIARMDADDIMHVDRLKVQYAIMEQEPTISVCSSTVVYLSNDDRNGLVIQGLHGKIIDPLLQLLRGNFVFHPTTMLRTDFLEEKKLRYKNYQYAEDYKLWTDIAKNGGIFYIESQPLLYYRVSDQNVSKLRNVEQKQTAIKIKKEILHELIDCSDNYSELLYALNKALVDVEKEELVCSEDCFEFFVRLFAKQRQKLLSV